jgi:hypothetical protein
MLTSIARALEQRDQTFGHGDRVAALAEPVALELGWDRERIKALRRSAPLHDVGKVKVSPQLLGKAGPLTLDEVAEIRRHPTAGAQLVLPLRRFHEALPYVLFHHERWDGDGYPGRGQAPCHRGCLRRDDLAAAVPPGALARARPGRGPGRRRNAVRPGRGRALRPRLGGRLGHLAAGCVVARKAGASLAGGRNFAGRKAWFPARFVLFVGPLVGVRSCALARAGGRRERCSACG